MGIFFSPSVVMGLQLKTNDYNLQVIRDHLSDEALAFLKENESNQPWFDIEELIQKGLCSLPLVIFSDCENGGPLAFVGFQLFHFSDLRDCHKLNSLSSTFLTKFFALDLNYKSFLDQIQPTVKKDLFHFIVEAR